jgi:hypothetical protein
MTLMPFIRHNLYRQILLILLLLLIPARMLLVAQNDCGTKIQEAQKYYEQGMIEEIPQMLAPCMENGFTRNQKIEAYKLIILSYLFDDNQFEAEKTMVEFLSKFPEYEIMPNDPVEFVYLFESYRTTSIFSFGFTAGFNLSDPRIIEPYTTFDMHNASLTNTMKPGFQVGVGVGRYISRKLFLNLELKFSENQYAFKDELITPLPGLNGIHSVSYKERLYKLMMPLTVAYEFEGKKFHYFIRTGVGVSKLMSASGTATRQYTEEIPPVTGETQNLMPYRKSFLYSGIIGTGVRYKVPHGVLTAEIRANIGLNNIVRSEKRYDNWQQVMQSSYLDDDFSLNVFSFSAGYYFSFYKPKKQADK